ncbi:uncharacterized protein N7473_009530 [Penicillium subrubescens]|uniref:uncharacterized protein n=1 Tax=Penicillium subrubescens TaxID=1316194 RepID=UPI0025452973|nr:uncharacterized protein N7473_009530 [Penicillium subrubescens]KAJ5886856.1 hypothetical protein N7473_009530 [Penicillium subrubescens]
MQPGPSAELEPEKVFFSLTPEQGSEFRGWRDWRDWRGSLPAFQVRILSQAPRPSKHAPGTIVRREGYYPHHAIDEIC